MKKLLFTLLFLAGQIFGQSLSIITVDEFDAKSTSGRANLVELVNTLNQIHDINFVVFTGLDCDLNEPEDQTPQMLKKILHPVYVLPSQTNFRLDKSAREKFMNKFGDLNFRKNFDSLKVLGLNSTVAWSEDPFFERETFSFLNNEKLDSLSNLVVILNGDPSDIQNFDMLPKYFNSAKINFIIAPLNSKKNFIEDRISILNSSLDSKRKEVFQLVQQSGDTLFVKTSDLSGKFGKPEIYVLNQNSLAKSNSTILYDPGKLLEWEYDAGYSVTSKIITYEDRIYSADVSGQVVCLDTLGKKRWEYFSFGYIYSTPTARDGYLAIGTVQGDLETVNARTGKQIQSLGFDSPITSDLTSFEYTGAYNFMLPKQSRSNAAVAAGTQDGTLYCYDLETLQELWRFEQPTGAITSKPLYAKSAILFYSLDGYLYSVNAQTGLLNWKSKLTDKNETNIYASDLVNNETDVFISLSNGSLFSFDILLGKKNWEYDKYRLATSLNISNDGRLIYAKSTNDRMHVLSAKLGTWVREIRLKIGNEKSATDIIELGKNIYFGNKEGYLIEIDPNYNTSKIFRNGFTPLNSIKPVGNKKLVLGSHDGTITLIRMEK